MTLLDHIDLIEQRLNAAAPAPWSVRYRDLDNHERPKVWAQNYGWLVTQGELPRSYHNPSMEFIAHSPTDIRRLIDACRVMYDKLKEIQNQSCHNTRNCCPCDAHEALAAAEKCFETEKEK